MPDKKNYTIPFRSQLSDKIEPGQTLTVQGKTSADAKRFTVNLHCNSPDFSGNDIPLHISVRFDKGKICLNAFQNGEWGKEDRKCNPFKKGENVDIRIRVHHDKYQVFCNHKELRTFEHRLPVSSVTHMSVEGDLASLDTVQWAGRYYAVPYESGLADGLGVGKWLSMVAAPVKKAKRFNVNLLSRNGDIAFHFNPRFDQKRVVRNNLEKGEWGNEEKRGKMPFKKAVSFDLVIRNELRFFQVLVNGEELCTFAHRTDPNEIAGLQIQGDLELTSLQINS